MATPDVTPDDPHADKLSDHCYDGIREYDNPTPGWWNWLFLATFILTPCYLLWFHSPYQEVTLADQYVLAQAANLKLQFGEMGDLAPDEATLLASMGDKERLTIGEATFQVNCTSCHGKLGEGISGVNLTDNVYKNVKTLADIPKVVHDGAAAGAMPAWGNRLHPNEVVLVAAYVATLRGQNTPGRAPEGTEIPPWPSQAPPAGAN